MLRGSCVCVENRTAKAEVAAPLALAALLPGDVLARVQHVAVSARNVVLDAGSRDIRIDPGGCKAVGFNLGTSSHCASKTTRESCCQTIISSTGPCESGGCKWEEAKITTYACYYTGPGPKACVWGPPSFPQFPPACTSDSHCTSCCPVTPPLTNKCISLTDPIECHKLTEEQCNGDCTYGPSSGVSMPKTLAPTFGLVITG